jgi:sigma-E factor negative regulatory protein RseB
MKFLAVALLALSAVAARADGNALSWLQRIHTATDTLNYSGTFVYRSGDETETSRIFHSVGRHGIRERLETLDGSPREIVRSNGEVKCYLPDSKTIKVDQQTDHKVFPAFLPKNLENISEHYKVTNGGIKRVAGHECQLIVLQPKDKLRYGHRLWVDSKTGMLLRSETLNTKNKPIQEFEFTRIRIGGKIDFRQLRSKYRAKSRGWHVVNSGATATNLEALGWTIKPELPGFYKMAEMMRTQGGSTKVGHVIYSDGLAAVSVFIGPMDDKTSMPPSGLSHRGAINIYTRQVAGHLVTVVGEAPAESVKRFAEAVEYRKP